MSTSKHIYYADSEYPRTIIVNHGGSENQIIYDSDDKISQNSIVHKHRRWLDKMDNQQEPRESWLVKALQRAKENGDL